MIACGLHNDRKYLYSHHATDPSSGRLVNAFDLVRLHRFGELDDDVKADTPTNRLPSYTAMNRLAVEDEQVSTLLNRERYDRATAEFDAPDDYDPDWISKLALSSTTGRPDKTINNVLVILENDPLLKGRLAFDEFANRGLALGALPWDERTDRRVWGDPDDAGMLHYLEHVYGIQIADKRMYAAMTLCAHKNRFNDVQKYLSGLEWDGVPRLDTLLIDYLGAADSIYTRAVMRKSLVAAVARAMTPGVKYDFMPIFVGPQGIGKSTFLRLLGLKWYSDSLQTFEGKEACEMIQGIWINEISEMQALERSEINAVKAFLSKQVDYYREAYGHFPSERARQCVFFGTTNSRDCLRDTTGGRRFWPIDIDVQERSRNVFIHLDDECDQIWAEAVVRWRMGETLHLSEDIEADAKTAQDAHTEQHPWEGMIEEFA